MAGCAPIFWRGVVEIAIWVKERVWQLLSRLPQILVGAVRRAVGQFTPNKKLLSRYAACCSRPV